MNRRPNNDFDLSTYGPCPRCYSWICKKLLWKHQKFCMVECETLSTASILTLSDALSYRITPCASRKMQREVFFIMKNDEIGKVARKDSLIIMLGNQWLQKNVGNRLKRGRYTSAVMRLASKLLINIRKLQPSENNMSDYLKPENFDNIVKATLLSAVVNIDDEEEMAKEEDVDKITKVIIMLII